MRMFGKVGCSKVFLKKVYLKKPHIVSRPVNSETRDVAVPTVLDQEIAIIRQGAPGASSEWRSQINLKISIGQVHIIQGVRCLRSIQLGISPIFAHLKSTLAVFFDDFLLATKEFRVKKFRNLVKSTRKRTNVG